MMNRTKLLAGLLIALVIASWIATAYFYLRLPSTIPTRFPPRSLERDFGSKTTLFVFPAMLTVVAAATLLAYRFRRRINFFGKRRLLALPEEAQLPVFERVYQVVLVIGIFIVLVVSYFEVSMALYALGVIWQFKTWPMLAALGVMALYIVFNLFLVSRMVRYAEGWVEARRGEDSGGQSLPPGFR